MAERFSEYGFFDGVTKVNQDNWPKYMGATQPDGIVNAPWIIAKYGGTLQVTANSSGMNVSVDPGFIYVHSHFGILLNKMLLPIAPADSALPRIDLVVARARYNPAPSSVLELDIIQGTPSSTPQTPTPTQTDSVIWELPLARVSVSAGVVSIGMTHVTDMRVYSVLPVEQGGTGATSAEQARNKLGINGIISGITNSIQAVINDIAARFNNSSGHNHNGTNSKAIDYSSIIGRPEWKDSLPGWWLDLIPPASANHGGHIDFHFNGDPADHTSRIIEVGIGLLCINGVLFADRDDPNVNLHRFRQIHAGTNALVPGQTALASGSIYLQYE